MEADYQYQVDYAKSGRAGCTKCKTPIAQDSLRIARLIQAANFDGKIPKWFHFHCFFTGKSKIQSTSEIKHFDSLRWADQEKIRSMISNDSIATVAPIASKFTIKLALPGLNCMVCKGLLLQERHMVHEGDKDSTVDYHLSCFLRSSHCPEDVSTLTGFKKLKQVDRDAVTLAHTEATKENLKRARPDSKTGKEPAAKKKKLEKASDDEDQNALRLQSNRLWKLRDSLEREVSKDALIGLLEYNEQHVPSGLSNLLEAVSDAMVFGALADCPSCKNGPLHYSNGQYKCSAMANEWAKCLYATRDPERKPFCVPKEYFDVEFLKNYKYVKRKRLFAKDSAPSVGPLSGCTVFVTNGPHDKEKSKEALVEECKALGAIVTEKLSSGLVVISSPKGFENMPKKDKTRVKALGLRIVDQTVLSTLKESHSSIKMSASQLTTILEKHTLSDWAIKPLMTKTDAKESSKAFSTSDTDDVMRYKVKNGAVVDPESGLEDRATVLKDTSGKPMSAVLGMVDLVRGSNSFYRLQALQADSKTAFWVFRAWGRIGTTIGGNKLEKFSAVSDARQAFEDLYLEKTGNEWRDRANFQKKPYKFYEMELDYGEEDQKRHVVASKPSTLHPALQSLIEFICDIESMKEAMMEFELDLRKMPLGKLSKRQIREAFGVLSDLSAVLEKASNFDQTALLSASTRFYTLIPHNFGMKAPPLLDNLKIIREKLKMLDDLLEIELAVNILKEDVESGEHPLDQHYKQLKTNLKPLDPKSEEYARIAEYVRVTHGSTHRHYSLELEAVFDVERPDEKERFEQFKPAQHNKMLLWHGSRRTNWVGILSQGLRIAPPEAPVTGYMFGKGIYFADVVSKSANYCFTSPSQPYGIMLLCEVILGDMDKCPCANARPLPSNCHSRMGVGSITPDPTTHYTSPDGVVYPIGKPIDSSVKNGSLIYNEYIVYNMDQVKQKYLVRVKFVY